MTVWCICDGDGYTWNSVCEIFTTKEKAEAYLEKNRDMFSRDEVDIIWYEVDPE